MPLSEQFIVTCLISSSKHSTYSFSLMGQIPVSLACSVCNLRSSSSCNIITSAFAQGVHVTYWTQIWSLSVIFFGGNILFRASLTLNSNPSVSSPSPLFIMLRKYNEAFSSFSSRSFNVFLFVAVELTKNGVSYLTREFDKVILFWRWRLRLERFTISSLMYWYFSALDLNWPGCILNNLFCQIRP